MQPRGVKAALSALYGPAGDTGTLAASVRMTTKYWYDERGRRIKSANPNGLFSKQAYDGAGRATASYVSYQDNETAYADANDVLGDIVIEQTKQSYDAAGNVWLARHFRRFDGLSGTGELNDPSGADPNALVTYTVNWFDDLGRTTTTAFYGTNGNTVIDTLPSEPAPNLSDDYIVTKYEYDANTGRVAWTKDNKARKTVRQYDDLGRTTKLIENYSDGVATNETPDKDRTTEYTYDPNSRLAIVTAKAQNSDYDQKTYYLFWNTDNGTTKSNVSNGSMVTAVVYPDSAEQTHVVLTDGLWVLTPTGTDYVAYAYDRLGRKTSATDQRQVVHAYAFSTTTGALLTDTVTFPGTLPASLDNTIKKIGYTYDDFGRTTKVTSYSDTGSTVANEVAFEYGPWGAVTKSMQDHAGAATDTDPNVQYAYEDGSGGADLDANFVRPDYVTYPGPSTRRVVYYNYASTGVGAPMSRLDNIASDDEPTASQKYASYMYLGAGTMVDANYPAVTGIPALTYGSRANSYSGLDRFGRVVDQKWQNQSGTPTVNDRFRYAYDRASNRTSRDPAADSHTPPDANDNYYTYDGLDRLVQSNWGTLDGSGVITDQNADANQAWTLDTVGNWSQFKWDTDGGGNGDPTVQARTHNTANEIQAISGTGADWVDPTYDLAGNMISGPQPRHETVDANTQWYKYDAWNRLVEVSQGASSPGTKVAQYRYDGLNRRIRKYVTSDYVIAYCGQDVLCGPGLLRTPQPSSYWNVTEYYYNESWQVLETREALEVGRWYEPLSEPGVSVSTREQYVWGVQYIDAPVVRFRDGNLDGDFVDAGIDSTLYYTYDGNFNVTALVKTDGTVAERYTYDPYGKVTFKAANWSDAASQAKSAYDNEILYCGYRWDPESGNYQVRNRYLTPPLGRWLTTDPIGYGDGMNWYQYVRSGPVGHRDPLGLIGAPVVLDTPGQALSNWIGGTGAQATLSDRLLRLVRTQLGFMWLESEIREAILDIVPQECNIAPRRVSVSGPTRRIRTQPWIPDDNGEYMFNMSYSGDLNNTIGNFDVWTWMDCAVGSGKPFPTATGTCHCMSAGVCVVKFTINDLYTFYKSYSPGNWVLGGTIDTLSHLLPGCYGAVDFYIHNEWSDIYSNYTYIPYAPGGTYIPYAPSGVPV